MPGADDFAGADFAGAFAGTTSSGVDGDDAQDFQTSTGDFSVGGGIKSKDLMIAIVVIATVYLLAKRK